MGTSRRKCPPTGLGINELGLQERQERQERQEQQRQLGQQEQPVLAQEPVLELV